MYSSTALAKWTAALLTTMSSRPNLAQVASTAEVTAERVRDVDFERQQTIRLLAFGSECVEGITIAVEGGNRRATIEKLFRSRPADTAGGARDDRRLSVEHPLAHLTCSSSAR